MNYEIFLTDKIIVTDSATVTHNAVSETTFLDAVNQFLAFVLNLSIA